MTVKKIKSRLSEALDLVADLSWCVARIEELELKLVKALERANSDDRTLRDAELGSAVRNEMLRYISYGPDPISDLKVRAKHARENGDYAISYLLLVIAETLGSEKEGGGNDVQNTLDHGRRTYDLDRKSRA